jgi:hypothetical protein
MFPVSVTGGNPGSSNNRIRSRLRAIYPYSLGVNAAMPIEVLDVRLQPSGAFWLLRLVPDGLAPNPEVSSLRRL